jgi:hypothetical protein
MDVIGQHRELDEPHTESIGSGHESFAHGVVLTPIAQVLETSGDAQRDVHRMGRLDRWTLRMRDTCELSFTLATGPLTCTTPQLELESSLMQDSHGSSACYDEQESAECSTKRFWFMDRDTGCIELDSAHIRSEAAAFERPRARDSEVCGWRAIDEVARNTASSRTIYVRFHVAHYTSVLAMDRSNL